MEGSVEPFTEVANILSDAAIMRDKSETALREAAYEAGGLSRQEAEKRTFLDCVDQVAWAAAGGVVSGGMMGGVTGGVNWAGNATSQNGTVLVDDQTVDALLNDRSFVDFLTRKGGLELTREMSREQKRAAVKDAVDQIAQKKTASTEETEDVRYSLKAFADGKRFVDVDTDQAQFDGLDATEMRHLATKVIKDKFAGQVIGLDNQVFVNGRSATEYSFPSKKLTPDLYEAKMRASTELDNLLDAGRNFRTEPDGRDGHTHPESVDDFRYFDTIFKVGDEYYEGVINIEPVKKGLLLKDITQIRNITQDVCSSYGQSPKSTFLRDTSMDSILPKSKKDNREVSTAAAVKLSGRTFATEEGTEAGLVWDEYVEKRLRPETADRINTIAQELGVRVRFVKSIRGGGANASIQGNEIRIERYNPNPVTYLLGHELTHRLQETAPEASGGGAFRGGEGGPGTL